MTSPAEVVWRILRQLELTDEQATAARTVVPEVLLQRGGQSDRHPREAHLVALDVLEAALSASTVEDLVAAAKPDLEVLSREDLIRVVMAVGAEVVHVTAMPGRPRVLAEVQRRRLAVMMDGSS